MVAVADAIQTMTTSTIHFHFSNPPPIAAGSLQAIYRGKNQTFILKLFAVESIDFGMGPYRNLHVIRQPDIESDFQTFGCRFKMIVQIYR